MFNYYNSIRSERQLKSLTGLGKKPFEELLPAFSESRLEISDEAYKKNRTKRGRRPGGGRKGQLPSTENKLYPVLLEELSHFDLASLVTSFDVLGFIFDLNPSNAEENVKKLLPILKRAQSKLSVLPKRSLKTDSELEEAIKTIAKPSDLTSKETLSVETPSVKHKAIALVTTASSTESASVAAKTVKAEEPLILIDVTERSHFRPKNNQLQKKYYSGKKKRHTVKNTLISDTKRRVIFLGRLKEVCMMTKCLKKNFLLLSLISNLLK